MKPTKNLVKSDQIEPKRLSKEGYKSAEKLGIFLILNNIRSGHNVGSIFRTADAFRIEKIYLTGLTAIPPNKEVLKTALGATETVNWEFRADALELILELKQEKHEIIAVEQTTNSTPLNQFIPQPQVTQVLIFGNEVNGVDREVLMECDKAIEIPQFGTKHSFNVSVCAGIVLWELSNRLGLPLLTELK